MEALKQVSVSPGVQSTFKIQFGTKDGNAKWYLHDEWPSFEVERLVGVETKYEKITEV